MNNNINNLRIARNDYVHIIDKKLNTEDIENINGFLYYVNDISNIEAMFKFLDDTCVQKDDIINIIKNNDIINKIKSLIPIGSTTSLVRYKFLYGPLYKMV